MRGLMKVQVAEAYVGIISAGDLLRLQQAQVRPMTEILQQAEVRFRDGEAARNDLA